MTLMEFVEKAGASMTYAFGDYVPLAETAVKPLEAKPTIPVEVMPPLVTESVVDRFKRELRAVIHEAGEHYCYQRRSTLEGNGCRYVYHGQGDCVVGRVLVRMGIPVGTLDRHEGTNAGAVVRYLWSSGDLEGPSEQLAEVANLADLAQVYNDAGYPWGHMLHLAR